MTKTMIDPFAMPTGLSLPERKWWQAMVAEIRREKRLAQALSREADTNHAMAHRARTDYARLRSEYRQRWSGKRPQWATDAVFSTLAVAKDCIDDDQFNSRQATERYAAAQGHYQRATELSTELLLFLRRRKEEALRRVPQQRREQS